MPDENFDFVIVGSGAGGLAAGITAKLAGLRPLVVEKTPFVGGSSIMSGGILWLPNNPVMKQEGVSDSRDAALRYMENFVEKGALYSTPARREAFVDNATPMMETMQAQGMEYRYCRGYCDYYDLLPGGHAIGRSVEAELFDANRLGPWKARMRLPYFPMPIRSSEASTIMMAGVTLKGKIMAARFAGRVAVNKITGRTLLGSGGALQGRMMEIALKLGVEIWTEAAFVDFDMRNGSVEGVHLNHAGRQMTIKAPRGVLICAGGFAHNAEMRNKYQRHPITNEWTFSNPGDTGEAVEAMARAGAGLAIMEDAWWNLAWFGPNGTKLAIVPELVRPHGILVDHAGKRMVNEAASYMEVGRAIYDRQATTPAVPAWLVLDARARKRYFFGFQPPGRMPKEWIEKGFVKQDSTLAGLAKQCGIDAAGLEATVARFNRFCETGVDEDYRRGESVYNRYYADPTKPNPALGPLSEPPYWAAPLWPGDVGTCGGATANERAEVMRPDGSVISGLYAAGNCTAPLCGNYYVGAGQSIASSTVFGYIAAKQAAQ